VGFANFAKFCITGYDDLPVFAGIQYAPNDRLFWWFALWFAFFLVKKVPQRERNSVEILAKLTAANMARRFASSIAPSRKEAVKARLNELFVTVSRNTQNHLGYPYNLQPLDSDLRPFMNFFLNNLGDAYACSNYGINTQDLEREVIDKFADMWGAHRQDSPIWGAVTSCGTEGNLLGILYGREAAQAGGGRATLVSSVESHYSVAKAARMYCMPYERVMSTPLDGEIDYKSFEEACRRIIGEGGTVVACVNAGSTVRGAHDRIDKMLLALDAANVPKAKRYLHVDAALSGLILPLIEEAKDWHFGFDLGADSIAVSGHKQLGTPLPCGVVCSKKEHMERWAAGTPAEADYVNTQVRCKVSIQKPPTPTPPEVYATLSQTPASAVCRTRRLRGRDLASPRSRSGTRSKCRA